jgi:ElaB/YqjD/DUF883 family membrane-anchored ribosome-binding protein
MRTTETGVETCTLIDIAFDAVFRRKRMTADLPPDAAGKGTRATASDDAFARLEQEMAAMKNVISGLSGQIADAASDIGTAAQEQAKRGLRDAHANMGSVAADASDRLGVVAGVAQSQGSSLVDKLEDAVRERPLSTVALALGLGFLIGAAWRR